MNPEAIAYQQAQEAAQQAGTPETGELLDATEGVIRRFVILTAEQYKVVSLWVLHCYAIEAADTTPYLAITSPEKRSGKSRLLEVLAQLVPRPMEAANISDAALFRALGGDGSPMTLLFDEIDAVFGVRAAQSKEELRGLINAGYRRGAVAWRCVGEGSKQEVRPYPVFGPKALAGIGDLPETIADRSVPIRLRRKSGDERVERGRFKTIKEAAAPIRTAAEMWAIESVASLSAATPYLPEELSDRAQDAAEPLLAIAELAGEVWAEQARESLKVLHRQVGDDSASWGVQLLADIRAAFGDRDRISSSELIDALKEDEEAPWAAWGKTGDGINPRALAKLLKPYGITRRDIRDGGWHGKGFLRDQFEDAWGRYLAPISVPSGDIGDKPPVEPKNGGSVSVTKGELSPIESGDFPLARAVVTDVTDTSPDKAEIERLEAKLGGGK